MPVDIIFLADDPLLKTFRARLVKGGYTVRFATSKKSLQRAINQQCPALIILDLELGKGLRKGTQQQYVLEICENLRRQPQLENVPILLLINGSDAVLEAAAPLVKADYLKRDAKPATFLARVSRLIHDNHSSTDHQPHECTLWITIEDTVSFALTGSETYPAHKPDDVQFTPNRAQFNRKIAFIGDMAYTFYDSFLQSHRRGDTLDEVAYREKWEQWRPQIISEGDELYRAIFARNPYLMEQWGRAQGRVGSDTKRLVLRFCGEPSNLALPIEALRNKGIPLVVLHPLARQLSGIHTGGARWEAFLKELGGKPLRALLLAGDHIMLDEIQEVEIGLRKALKKLGLKVLAQGG